MKAFLSTRRHNGQKVLLKMQSIRAIDITDYFDFVFSNRLQIDCWCVITRRENMSTSKTAQRYFLCHQQCCPLSTFLNCMKTPSWTLWPLIWKDTESSKFHFSYKTHTVVEVDVGNRMHREERHFLFVFGHFANFGALSSPPPLYSFQIQMLSNAFECLQKRFLRVLRLLRTTRRHEDKTNADIK